MFVYTYPLADLFWTMLEIFLFIIWIWLLVAIFSDIFRSDDLGGWAKALWVIFVIVLPFLGILVYLIARGHKMQEHVIQNAQQEKQAFDAHVRGVTNTSSVDQLAKLAELKDQGVLTASEFEAQKAKLLS